MNPATQADIQRLDLRLDALVHRIDAVEKRLDRKIDDSTQRLALGIDKTNGRLEWMQEFWVQQFSQFKSDTLGRLDTFIGKLETYARETVSIPKTLDEHGKILAAHEVRITALERR